MTDVESAVYAALDELRVPYEVARHAPVHTIEDCKIAEELLGGLVPKNLFLAPRTLSSFWLLIAHPQSAFHTANVSKQIGCSRLSFAPAEKLMEYMQTLPGAISPMGLLFDTRKQVTLLIDEKLRDEPELIFHPCVNTASLRLHNAVFFEQFLPAIGRPARLIPLY